jgi:hypothetical protein
MLRVVVHEPAGVAHSDRSVVADQVRPDSLGNLVCHWLLSFYEVL